MGLVDELQGQRVFIDTAPFIYYIEKHKKYINIVKPVFQAIDTGEMDAITSTITLLEVLVHPLRTGNEELANQYREILLDAAGLTTYEVSHEISEKAAKLRAKYSIKTPDAIQVSIDILYGAEMMLTNDTHLQGVSDIKVLILDDYLIN